MLQKKRTLNDLQNAEQFVARHVGPSVEDQQTMLGMLDCSNLQQLIEQVVPESIINDQPLDLLPQCTESQALKELRQIANKNKIFKSFLGQGYYGTLTPNVILRNILENPAWYTAYTPYQPEISQGRLEALINFQTMVTDLTGLEIANASMLDEGTAAAEAMTLSRRVSKSKSNRFFVDGDCLPQTIDIIATRAEPLGIEVEIGKPDECNGDVFGMLLQYPGVSGAIQDHRETIAKVKAQKGIVVMAADILSLVLLESPGSLGADIAIGSTQRFGVPMGFGGPHAAYMATKEAYKRNLPGRIVGLSQDAQGNPAYRLALQTREQHIRREKATSNICTAQVLLAVIAGMYAVYHGPKGLSDIANRVHMLTTVLANGLNQHNIAIENTSWFDTLTINTGANTSEVIQKAEVKHVNLRQIDQNHVGISLDQTSSAKDVILLWDILIGQHSLSIDQIAEQSVQNIPGNMMRTESFLDHETFNSYHSETEMLRYIRKLSDKDIALDRAMIPLGSCTMKLNATAEMLPVTWPEFANIHPFAPSDQTQGYQTLINQLESMLSEITGYDGISLQPNAGSQGEYAGLLAIKSYHESRGDSHRNICLIPSSAHGTNPASAHMCGMNVVVVACDEQGNVDIDDLNQKAAEHSDNLSAIMVTYPSTHGVFEEKIMEICELIHKHGGQVYMDGANLNALVGIAKPGNFGPDVCHINLHKTFCIPHGGGGPGMGPIACKRHLQVYLPNHPVVKDCGPATGIGAVSAAPWGSSSILSISWMYIKMMGSEGLKLASKVAILNANYIADRLKDHYPILYKGSNGNVAHECIIDIRSIKSETGITEEDIAKRLIDFGFHAPTMSWPVAGTMMIEPTESENLSELDRFCDTLIKIKQEIDLIKTGKFDKIDNPIKNAPHTDTELASDNWTHKYSREEAAYPAKFLKINKFWPPVARVDNVYGDKNIFCTCPSMDEFKEDAA